MRYTISSPQVSHFRRERFLDLEGLITEDEALALREALDHALDANPSGRDLERKDPVVKKGLHLTRLGQIGSALFGRKRLRLAFTQYPPCFETASFEEMSSITEVEGGCVIDLLSGKVIFYPADEVIDFEAFAHPIIILGISKEFGRYKLQEKDPHTHLLKKLGYGFGDKPTEATHPLILK